MEIVDLVQNASRCRSPAGRSCARHVATATAGHRAELVS
jgi:hypothetical protein